MTAALEKKVVVNGVYLRPMALGILADLRQENAMMRDGCFGCPWIKEWDLMKDYGKSAERRLRDLRKAYPGQVVRAYGKDIGKPDEPKTSYWRFVPEGE